MFYKSQTIIFYMLLVFNIKQYFYYGFDVVIYVAVIVSYLQVLYEYLPIEWLPIVGHRFYLIYFFAELIFHGVILILDLILASFFLFLILFVEWEWRNSSTEVYSWNGFMHGGSSKVTFLCWSFNPRMLFIFYILYFSSALVRVL